jgi:hypothetical protein
MKEPWRTFRQAAFVLAMTALLCLIFPRLDFQTSFYIVLAFVAGLAVSLAACFLACREQDGGKDDAETR